MDWQEGTTIAQRLRVRGSGLDALTTRLRLTSLLEAVDLRPPGLPPSAVICIRRLRDPLPGALSLQHIGQRPPQAWEHALRHALAQSVRQAVRPVEGAVPANAGAVVFNDRAELLACLAHDWCEGAIDMHWWWQSLLRGEFDRSVLAAWLAAPEYAPAALQHLAQRGTVLPFAEKLSTGEARQLLESITRSFALYELQPLLSSLS
ncbi:MAG TPA: hypothetical protein VFQ30_00570, partial [Ktedonobacteraceae bacterium]|nr:hypothetical protein [Ktedonobacteraceae bacterium]